MVCNWTDLLFLQTRRERISYVFFFKTLSYIHAPSLDQISIRNMAPKSLTALVQHLIPF